MRKKSIPTTLIVILVLAVVATTVFAYCETWEEFIWSNGTLYYNNNAYTCGLEGGYFCDSTAGDDDLFYVNVGGVVVPFTYSTDTIWLTVSSFGGSKPTGQSGEVEDSGTWSGSAYVKSTSSSYTLGGTWNSRNDDFDYTSTPWTWDGEAEVMWCTPSGITGDGWGSGDIECTSNSAPCGSCD
ncbi:hypothetical protein GF338_11275 [candidate division WOR-3 bacterium]|nr:hypothetical protein [candidate division WOR-3 bacterium]